MPYTSPLEVASVSAASIVRSKISRTKHDRYAWLHPPDGKKDCENVVGLWLKDNPTVSKSDVIDYYPVVWTDITGTIEPGPFPGNRLVMLGLDYMDKNNGLPKVEKESLSPGEHVIVQGDVPMELSSGGGGITLFIILKSEKQSPMV